MGVELGIIEGFYGRPWPWEARLETATFLAPHGYRFYLYAPKGDPYLRRRWQEPHPAEWAARLAELAAGCRAAGVRFGVGLSPYEVYASFDEAARAALTRKLEVLASWGVEDLAILFDDMRGDGPDLAQRQGEVVDWIRARSAATRHFVCPTYYSDDPVLDRVFGRRAPDYVERLGEALDPELEVFWTGEEVVSREISVGHLRRVAGQLRRKPFLWDNYPVNDGQRMSRFLYLRGFTGRPAALAEVCAGHGINPALQPVLSRIPALTLAESYQRGAGYAYGDAFRRAARAVLGDALGERLWEDVLVLQDVGLERLTEEQRTQLRARYADAAHPGAREIIDWLDGAYGITDEVVRTQ